MNHRVNQSYDIHWGREDGRCLTSQVNIFIADKQIKRVANAN